jgi:hypothetical protein
VNVRLEVSRSAERARGELVDEVLLHRGLRVDRDVVQAGEQLLLVLGGVPAQRARHVVARADLRDDRAQPAAGGDEA